MPRNDEFKLHDDVASSDRLGFDQLKKIQQSISDLLSRQSEQWNTHEGKFLNIIILNLMLNFFNRLIFIASLG